MTDRDLGATADLANLPGRLALKRARIDDAISAFLKIQKASAPPHSRLLDAVEYSIAGGGKRLRPILVLEACELVGGGDDDCLAAAVAVECVHAFSLVHDDLPGMDDDDLRRGRPTNHKVFGEALAILAGDWLLANAFRLVSSDMKDRAVSVVVSTELAESTLAMIDGQAADIAGQQSAPDGALVRYIHRHKTARLIEACCRMGGICGRATAAQVEALGAYGRHLGLAFQIVDDLLDRTGSTEVLGKRVGKDADHAKQTFPAAFGLDASRIDAQRETGLAVAALQPFGPGAGALAALAHHVLSRDR